MTQDARKEAALAQLAAQGVKLGSSGDVAALKLQIQAETATARAKPKLFSPAKQCLNKRRYSTEDAAARVARRVQNPDVHPYYCAHCLGFHNGKPPKR